MDPNPPNAPALTFAVDYQPFTGAQNTELKGKGLLTIKHEEPLYQFTGKRRAMFGGATALSFRFDQIWNVAVDGRQITFTPHLGVAGTPGKPFVFYCASSEAAAEVARLLPAGQDGDFVVRRDFQQKLASLPSAASPWSSVTNLLIAINLVAFVIMGCLGAGWIEVADMKPYLLYVANNGGATTDGEWWRIVTSMFVHYGLLHLALNMWALFQTGHFVERLFGRPLFALGYLGSGILASFTSLLWHGDKIWSAGASGAVFGVYGLLLGFMLRERQSIPQPVLRPLFKSTATFAGYNLFFGLIHPQIDNAAHIGGLLGGIALGWLTALPVETDLRKPRWPARLALGLGAVAVLAAAGIAFSPRYDYRVRDELSLGEVNKAPTAAEPGLLKQQEALVTAAQNRDQHAALRTWVDGKAVPFYADWRRGLAALSLAPDKVTHANRQLMVRYLDTKLADYRELSAGLHRNDPNALQAYNTAEQRAFAEFRSGAAARNHR